MHPLRRLLCCIILLPSLLSAVVAGSQDAFTDHLERAYNSYAEAEHSTISGIREQAFNRALRLYSQLETEPGNGKLYYNIGNTYFQLGQFEWAILYYLKAQRLLPRDPRVQYHLALAQAHQNIAIEPPSRVADVLFFWHRMLSQSERIRFFVALMMLLTFFASVAIWRRDIWFARVGGAVGVVAALVLASILYFQYVAPIEAVVVKAYGLYHGPSDDFALVRDEPFVPGSVVDVQSLAANGSWAKIQTPTHQIGYVPADVIRLVASD